MEKIRGHHGLASLGDIFDQIRSVPLNACVESFLTAAGVAWHDGEEPRLVAAPSVHIVALGGVPLVVHGQGYALASSPDVPLDLDAYRSATEALMGYSGMMSYLNAGRRSAGEMFDLLSDRGEMSVAHAVTVSLLVSGVSTAAENEFNSQRDLVHLSRITVARSVVQDSPPLVVSDPLFVPAFREVWQAAARLRSEAQVSTKDQLELANTMFPAAKATAFILTASLRNLMKMLGQEHDQGKEREYRAILSEVRRSLSSVWPSIF